MRPSGSPFPPVGAPASASVGPRLRRAAAASIVGVLLAFPAPSGSPAPAAAQSAMPAHRLFSIERRPPADRFRGAGVAVGPRGDIYWLDAFTHRVVQFDAQRRFARTWGSPGAREGQFDLRLLNHPQRVDDGHTPTGIAVAPDGAVIVADMANHRIQRFTADGRFLLAWGRRGTGAGEMQGPGGVAAAPDGTIYVSDTFNHRVQHFGADGRGLGGWPLDDACGAGEAMPVGIAVTAEGTVFVGDGRTQHPCIMAFDRGGRRLTEWTPKLDVDPSSNVRSVRGLAAAPDGTLVAVEHHEQVMVARYRPDGRLVDRWHRGVVEPVVSSGTPGSDGIAVAPDGTIATASVVYSPDGQVVGAFPPRSFADFGQFEQAEGMTAGPDGTVYVADPPNGRVQAFDPDGRFRRVIDGAGSADGALVLPMDVAVAGDGTVYVIDTGRDRVQAFGPDGRWLRGWGVRGRGPGAMIDPEGIAIGPDGTVYVADSGNHRVQRFAATGVFLGKWGRRGDGPGEIETPRGIVVAPDGTVRVVDSGNRRVQVFAPDGTALYSLGDYGVGDGQFVEPVDIAVDATGGTYVSDAGNQRLHRFDACGRVLQSWGGAIGGSAAAGRMVAPKGVAVAADGTVYVGDSTLRRVQRFAADGSFASVFGWLGLDAVNIRDGNWSSEGTTLAPYWIVVGSDGTLSMSDSSGVRRFGSDGTYLGQWSVVHRAQGALAPQIVDMSAAPDGSLYVVGQRGEGYPGPDDPFWLHRYTTDGVFLGGAMLQGMRGQSFGSGVAPDGTLIIGSSDAQGKRVNRFRTDGTWLGQWRSVWPATASGFRLAVGPDGTAFLARVSDWTIAQYTLDGTLLGAWGRTGNDPGQLGSVCDGCREIWPLVAGRDGTIYAGDITNQRIQRFTADGRYLGALPYSQLNQIDPRPRNSTHRNFTVGPEGRIFVVGAFEDSIDVYAAALPAVWHAAFYGDRWLTQRALAVEAPAGLDFAWGEESPAPDVPFDRFSARFERLMTLPEGAHDIAIDARGGVRVWVDDRLLVDAWDGPMVDQVAGFTSTGDVQRVTVEYNDPGGAARLRVDIRRTARTANSANND